MKKITIAILLFSPLVFAAGGPNPAEYTVNVHVSSSSIGPHGLQVLDVVIDGKKYELQSELAVGRLLALGDFKAKLVTNRKTAYESLQVYEFLFPDKTRQYEVVGQTDTPKMCDGLKVIPQAKEFGCRFLQVRGVWPFSCDEIYSDPPNGREN